MYEIVSVLIALGIIAAFMLGLRFTWLVLKFIVQCFTIVCIFVLLSNLFFK